MASVVCACCLSARLATPARSATRMTAANTPIAARATPTNATARRTPNGPSHRRPMGSAGILAQTEAVPGTQYGLHNPGRRGVGLDLATQVFDVRVDGPLVTLEFISANTIDELVA